MQSGDGDLWWFSNFNPYPESFFAWDKDKLEMESGIMAWRRETDNGDDSLFEKSFTEFTETDYFKSDDLSSRLDRPGFFGRADTGNVENKNLAESIKKISTKSDFPIAAGDTREIAGRIKPGEIVMVTYDLQSIDMSVYVAALKVATPHMVDSEVNSTPAYNELTAVDRYNGKGDPNYHPKLVARLKDFGTSIDDAKNIPELEERLKELNIEYVEKKN